VAPFRKSQRLLRRADFDRVSQQGKRRHSRHFVVLYLENELGHPRLGVIASRKVGNAVARNRVKRRIREWFRGHALELAPLDLVVIARREAPTLTAPQVAAELVESTSNLYKGPA
jgi:ribonuclease P protein component